MPNRLRGCFVTTSSTVLDLPAESVLTVPSLVAGNSVFKVWLVQFWST